MTILMRGELPGPVPCSSCRAPVVWANTTAGLAVIALEPGPSEHGNVTVYRADNGSLHATILRPTTAAAHRHAKQPLYLTHVTSCPRAHNRKRK